MERHDSSALGRFLSAVDDELTEPAGMVIIGGAAAALAYGSHRITSDIDAITPLSLELEKAAQRARERTGLDIPITTVGVHDGPYDFEERLSNLGQYRRLKVLVPERHDLALMKIVRGYEHDLEALEDMHRVRPFDERLLVTRFVDEMKHVNKPGRELKLNFLALISRICDVAFVREVEAELRRWDVV